MVSEDQQGLYHLQGWNPVILHPHYRGLTPNYRGLGPTEDTRISGYETPVVGAETRRGFSENAPQARFLR